MESGIVRYKFMSFGLGGIIAETMGGVCKIELQNDESDFLSWIRIKYPDYKIVKLENEIRLECEKQISEYFEGTRKEFNLKLDLKLTNFQHEVFNVLLKVPYGSVVSYGDIANKVGGAKYSRAVGNALNKNPLPIIIPCHRVIDSKGGIGGFYAGVDIKKTLLNLEKEMIKEKV